MSASNNQKKRGVRFTEESIANGSERVAQQRPHDDDPRRKRQKRPRQDRPNEDELDDVDDYLLSGG